MKKNNLFRLLFAALISCSITYISFAGKDENTKFKAKGIYEKDWKTVDSLNNKGLPKSALSLVEQILTYSEKQKNYPQYIKALLYQMNLRQQVNEEASENELNELPANITKAPEPAKQILASISGELYWRYYQNNRYKFYNRTSLSTENTAGIATWDLKKILGEVRKAYQNSIKNDVLLKSIKVADYEVIIENKKEKGKNKNDEYDRSLRPTLYDFIAHRAIDALWNTELETDKPEQNFEVNKPEYFLAANEFIKLSIGTADSNSLFIGLKIMQDVLAFHINDKDKKALMDADLKRFKLLKQNSTINNKDSLFENGLQAMLQLNKDNDYSATILYELARLKMKPEQYYDDAYEKTSQKNKGDLVQAVNYCVQAINQYPQALGTVNCKALKLQMEQPSFTITNEEVLIPKTKWLTNISYKNLARLYYKIVKLENKKELNAPGVNRERNIELLLQKPLVSSGNWDMKPQSDYYTHTTEAIMNELNSGFYALLVATNENFQPEENGVAINLITVSNISLITRQKNYSDTLEIIVNNRQTGEAIEKANVEIISLKYDSKTRTNISVSEGKLVTDKYGKCTVSPTAANKNVGLRVTYKEDVIETESRYYLSQNNNDEGQQTITHLFTDRAIYRPGQTVYFKGILTTYNKGKQTINAGKKAEISFFDVNGTLVKTQNYTSNTYGSIAGNFIIPTGLLNGSMRIGAEGGDIYFSVEEYKRPTFEVIFDTIKQTYLLGDEVEITGKVTAFSGAPVDNASVKVNITSTSYRPFDYFRYYNRTGTKQIKNETIKTDNNGLFKIKFVSLATENLNNDEKLIYSYSITCDATDMNGETQSAIKDMTITKNALLLNVEMPNKHIKNEKLIIKVNAVNGNGDGIAANGKVDIYELQQPEKLSKKRLWKFPENTLYTPTDFAKYFPEEANNDSLTEQENYAVKSKISSMDYASSEPLKVDASQWNAGVYKWVFNAKDKNGNVVTTTTYLTLYDSGNGKAAEQVYLYGIANKATIEPNEKFTYSFGSAAKDLKVYYEIILHRKVVKKEILTLNQNQKEISFPIDETYRGNFQIMAYAIQNNRLYKIDDNITVPYTNKEIDISFESFRDKLKPGEKEQWKVKLKNKKGDAVTAEMMASVYDASLDNFAKHQWNFNPNYFNQNIPTWNDDDFNGIKGNSGYGTKWIKSLPFKSLRYDELNWFGYNYYGGGYGRGGGAKGKMFSAKASPMNESAGDADMERTSSITGNTNSVQDEEIMSNSNTKVNNPKANTSQSKTIPIRTNFNETAFFYPQLEADAKGDLVISFTIPESLTKWKMLGLAHSKDLMFGMIEKEFVTQKELMITQNLPRFLRIGDEIEITAKVNNLSVVLLNGNALLEIKDAATLKPADINVQLKNNTQPFTCKAGESAVVTWKITVPQDFDALTFKVSASAGNFTDGEEKIVPILSNSMLVTESLPLWIKGNTTKKFSLQKLVSLGASTTLKNQSLTLEFTPNPVWYAVQALPYMMEYPHDCAEQTFNRFYANALAGIILKNKPNIKTVFDNWKLANSGNKEALLSNLEKNEDLKNILLNETPWVMEAKDESERKKRIALLFDLNKMQSEQNNALNKLKEMQQPNGGFGWFKGMPDNEYITAYIATGWGHLRKLGLAANEYPETEALMQQAVFYCDERMRENYERIIKENKELKSDFIGEDMSYYLYMRSFYDDELAPNNQKAFDFFMEQATTHWVQKSKYTQGLIALALFRHGDKKTANEIIKSLEEFSIKNEEFGMYWKENVSGYYWYQMPIETQALLIETFAEITNDKTIVDDLKIWLIRQKQTQNWKSTKATAEACYALLLQGSDWLSDKTEVSFEIGNTKLESSKIKEAEAGSGYFKKVWDKSDIKPEMGNITIAKNNDGLAYGGLYWQYFENLDKITDSENKTGITINKELYIKSSTANGKVLNKIDDRTMLKRGDFVTVRIIIKLDRRMEYIHLKDMRAAGFEPTNVISSCKYQDGLYYYQTTKDASTNFFFSSINKGTYVFEYDLKTTHKGSFSNGISTMQCMYAPEFSTHSAGQAVKVVE